MLLLFAWLPARAAAAEPSTEGEKAFAKARLEDGNDAFAELDLARALAAFEDVLAHDPHGNAGYEAGKMVEMIRARSEGDFVPLRTLLAVRRSGGVAPDAIDDLVKAADGWPEGLVRVEAWHFAATAYAERLGRPQDAEQLLRKVLADPRASHDSIKFATHDLVGLRLRARDYDDAARIVAAAGPHADDATKKLVERARLRARLHVASIVAVVVPLAGLLRAARSRKAFGAARRVLPLALVYVAYVALAGAALATGYERGTSKPFLFFGLVLLPLLLLARVWSAAGAQTTRARIGRALACATSAFGAGFLVLEYVDVAFLEGLGL